MNDFNIKEQKLNNTWDNLSLADKSQVIKVAVANGLTSMSDIKDKYNKFAEGGDLSQGTSQDSPTEDTDLLNMPWYEIYPDVTESNSYVSPLGRSGSPVKKDANYKHAIAIYQGLKDRGIPDQAAFELTNQKILEGGWKNYFTGDSKRYKAMDPLLDHIASWMKTSYPDTIKARNFNEFYNGLMNGKNGKYNSRPGYKKELQGTRSGVLRRINDYRKSLNQPPLTILNDTPYVAPRGINSYVVPQETLTPIIESNIAAYGGPVRNKKSKKNFEDWSKKLSDYWGEDISTHDYDYKKYYDDNPKEAYKQLNHILSGGKGHFPDEGKSGIYKKLSHPTYPDLGDNSWSDNDTVFHISDRQLDGDTDKTLNYLGEDLNYNNGGTKVMYQDSYLLPSETVTPNGSYSDLVPNKLHTGYVYEDSPVRAYAEGGNLYAKGGKMNSKRSSPNNNVQRALGYLMGKGVSKTGASAIIGVLQSESNLNPSIRAQMKGDNGEGIAQWTGSRKNVFWNTLEKIEPGAKKKYGSIINVPLHRQLDVVLKERPSITKAIHNAKDVQTATDIMLRGYENGGGTINTMISRGQMDKIYSKWGNGYSTQMKRRLGNAYNLLGVKVDPNSFNFNEDYISPSMMENDVLPERLNIPYPDTMSTIDPTTVYQPPTINPSVFKSKPTVTETPVYDPQQERRDNLQGLNTVMSLLNQGSIAPTMTNNSPQGLLSYINAIYS